eukprot:10620023-Heterocapsa_arctica.AAC.1
MGWGPGDHGLGGGGCVGVDGGAIRAAGHSGVGGRGQVPLLQPRRLQVARRAGAAPVCGRAHGRRRTQDGEHHQWHR